MLLENPVFSSATAMAAAIREGRLSAVQALDACLDQIDRINQTVNAVVQRADRRARKEAAGLDAMFARGHVKGPLHGVPITVKDSLDTEGIVSTGGTLGRSDFRPDRDAPVVARLRDAGAVLIGKTNTPELTIGSETDNLIYGSTRNPYDHDLSPGASSGGSAAIVAAGGSALELGSDTGGSIREPAHLCGIAGLKPTSGRVPRSGHILPWGAGALDSLTTLGPMARAVEDLSLGLSIICGPDGEDPGIVPVPLGNPEDVDLSGLRIAVFDHNGVTEAAPDLRRVVNEVADALSDLGLNIESAVPTSIPRAADLYFQLRQSASGEFVAELLERYGTDRPSPHIRAIVDGAPAGPARVDNRLLQSIDNVRSEFTGFMTRFDAILCPPSHSLARPLGGAMEDSMMDWSYITVQNLFGIPGVVVRAGTSSGGNLPVGVQVNAPHWREDIALALAGKIEQLFGGFIPPQV